MNLLELIKNEKLPDFKQLRKANSLTLRKVEELTGISNAYLSQLETGKIESPSWLTVIKLLKIYLKWETKNINSIFDGDPNCSICHGLGFYYYGGSFGGPITSERCRCKKS